MSDRMTADRARQLLKKSEQQVKHMSLQLSAKDFSQDCLHRISVMTKYPFRQGQMYYVVPAQFIDEVEKELLNRGFGINKSAYSRSHHQLDISW